MCDQLLQKSLCQDNPILSVYFTLRIAAPTDAQRKKLVGYNQKVIKSWSCRGGAKNHSVKEKQYVYR
jgi:hypothetical protein